MNRFVLIIAFIVMSMVTNAQVSMGTLGGASYSKWTISGADTEWITEMNEGVDRRIGVNVELPVEVTVRNGWVLGSGVGMMQRGYHIDGNPARFAHLNYLQIPLTIGHRVKARRIEFTPHLGAALGMSLRGAWGFNDPRSTLPIGRSSDGDEFWSRSADREWAIIGGIRLGYDLGQARLIADLGHQQGINDVFYTGLSNFPETRAVSSSFFLRIGYMVDLGTGKRTTITDTTNAQRSSSIKFGHRSGMTYSTISFSAASPQEDARVNDGSEPLMGITVAWMANIRINGQWSLQPELAYIQKGWRAKWTAPTMENDILRLNYLEMPILISYRHGHARLKPMLLAGPVIGRGIGGLLLTYGMYGVDEIYPYAGTPHFTAADQNFGFNPWDVSAMAGAGFSYSIGDAELLVDLRYQHSFTNMKEGRPNWFLSEEVNAFHRNWMLNVGYLLPW